MNWSKKMLVAMAFFITWSCLVGCSAQSFGEPEVAAETATAEVDAETASDVEEAATAQDASEEEAAPVMNEVANCVGGAVKDDGTVETGYGFVPQSTDGVYVQKFDRSEFASPEIDKVCVCFLKTKHVRDIEYDVVFFQDAGGVPAQQPYARVPAAAFGLPESVASAGQFFEVDVPDVRLPEGPSYIGVQWDPNRFKFLFVCTNTSEETPKTPVFFRDDVKPVWQDVFNARDPIFRNHHSILLRARAKATPQLSSEQP